MDFPENTPQPKNLLPFDGEAFYFGKIIPAEESQKYFHFMLETVPWKNEEIKMFGKSTILRRKTAWYSTGRNSYSYSNSTKEAEEWTDELLHLKDLVEQKTKTGFNSCLLNLYPSGEEGMGWHSDNEKSIEENSPIASLSFGAERRFSLKHKISGEKISVILETGSLLLMSGTIQKHWLHSLPKSKKVKEPRINLTFRRMRII